MSDSLNYYTRNNNFEKAVILGEKIKQDLIKKNDNENLAVINSNLGIYYYNLGDYNNAKISFDNALKLQEEKFGKDNVNLAIIKKHASKNYKELGNYSEAKNFINEAILTFKSKLGENNTDYADALNVLGTIYKAEENYKLCIPLFEKSSEIFKNKYGENEIYASPLSNLGHTYFLLGEYDKAEIKMLKAIDIFKKSKNLNKSNYGLSLITLADFYIAKGQYPQGENCLFEAGEIFRSLGENNPKFISVVSKLGFLYVAAERYDDATEILKKGIELTEKKYGVKNANTLANKSNLSLVYLKTNKIFEAQTLNEEVLKLTNELYGINNRKYINTLNNQALIYSKLKKYHESEESYKKAFKISNNIYSENYSEYSSLLENISTMYIDFLKPNDAFYYINKLFNPFVNQISNASNFLSTKEFTYYLSKEINQKLLPLSFLENYPNQYREINLGCYQNELLVKGLSLRNQQRIQNNIQKSGDATLKSNYNQFVTNKRQLVKLKELPIDKRPVTFDKLTIETEQLEKDLIRQSTLFADAKKSLSTTWKQIQDQLKPNEAAIDLVAFNYYNKKWTDSIVYSAFVVSKSCKYPKYIPLFEQKQLNALLQSNHAEHDSIQAKKLNRQYTDRTIADLFLKPLLSELENVTTIYLSPAGLSHQINFSALPISDSQTFGAKYALHLLGSTTTLIDYTPGTINKKENPELLLYGDIDYGKTNAIKKEINEDSTISSQIDFNETNTRGVSDSFGNLGGTLKELNTIADLAKVEGFQTTQIKQADATEESIKALDGRSTPYILHLATHGFFFPDPKVSLPDNTIQINESVSNSNRDAMYKSSEDPMMRSGLAMAGANKYWKKPIEKLTTDDGILTANEISNLDLSACQLVVLSACETGLGDINGSEGVFGLQRAFKIAGVKNIIMSLWKVPDSQTSELFEVFYSECFAGKTIHEAFQSAQSQMKAKYSPFYWAGFVLLE